jgi:hypothetical protein
MESRATIPDRSSLQIAGPREVSFFFLSVPKIPV